MEEKLNGFILTAILKNKSRVYRLHNAIAYQMSLRYRYRSENEGLAALSATIVSLNNKKRKIMLLLCIRAPQSLITTPKL